MDVKENINKLSLPKNEQIDSYFYLNRQDSEVEYNGLKTPIQKDGLGKIESFRIFLEAHANSFFNIKNDIGQNFCHRIKDEYKFNPEEDLTIKDVYTHGFTNESITNICLFMATQFIDNTNLLFMDITKLSQFNTGGIFVTFNIIKYLDEFFKENNLTRIYKHYNNFYFINYGTT